MSRTQYIPDLVASVVGKVDQTFSTRATNPFNVYYDFGHHEAVVKNLIYKDGNPDKPAKYPLVWLVTPFKEKRGGIYDLYATCDLHFVIAYYTEANYSMEERRDKVFLPILYPVYAELLRQLAKSHSFQVAGPEPEHEKMDLQYAKVDSNGTNLFNDFVDVIDLKISNVQVKNIC